jgi:hypothetical protein
MYSIVSNGLPFFDVYHDNVYLFTALDDDKDMSFCQEFESCRVMNLGGCEIEFNHEYYTLNSCRFFLEE